MEASDITIINYPGSKRRLLDFIDREISKIANNTDVLLDIFAGTGVVGVSQKNKHKVLLNDAEVYSQVIGEALLNGSSFDYTKVINSFYKKFEEIKKVLFLIYPEQLIEQNLIHSEDTQGLVNFYKGFKNVWQDGYEHKNIECKYHLFSSYYSNSYFGLFQSIEIDSIRGAIDSFKNTNLFNILLSALYYAMKVAVFSKDGHMAQPLNVEKNSSLLLKRRKENIYDLFAQKLKELSGALSCDKETNEVYNLTLENILNNPSIIKKADIIYADPPYTDMQYSRYFHLLTTVTLYDYPKLTKKNGIVTNGLYREERFQSPLSQHGKAKKDIERLIQLCQLLNKKLIFSYAYPRDIEKQQTSRYTVSIDELKQLFLKYYKENEVCVVRQEYEHSNNKNSKNKAVYEYLIIANPSLKTEGDEFVKRAIKKIEKTIGTNDHPIYKSHLYWSQKAYNICDILIQELSQIGDVVCDPFMGSGVTIIQSLKKGLNRRSIGIEINEYPISILRTLLAKYDINKIELEAKKLKDEVTLLNKHYMTTCDCGKYCVVDKSMFDIEGNSKTLKTLFYKCDCNKKQIKKSNISQEDINNFLNYKLDSLQKFKNLKLIENSRIAVKPNETLYDKFSARNIYIIDKIITIISNYNASELFKYALCGCLHLCKITDIKSSSQWPLWIPKKDCIEKNVVSLFLKAIDKTMESIKAIKSLLSENRAEVNTFKKLGNNNYFILKKGTQLINEQDIPSETVDLIITDPPYLGQVIYSEYTQLYQSILNHQINYDDEIIINKTNNKTKTDAIYYKELGQAFKEISRILKRDGYLCLYFHDSNLAVWNKLINIMNKNNLQYIAQTHINKSKNTLKNILSSKKSLNGDSLLFFKKQDCTGKKATKENCEDEIGKIAKDLITSNGGEATTAYLYDNGVMNYCIKENLLEDLSKKYKDLTQIFDKYLTWNNEKGCWN